MSVGDSLLIMITEVGDLTNMDDTILRQAGGPKPCKNRESELSLTMHAFAIPFSLN